jgi:hypothetical protein
MMVGAFLALLDWSTVLGLILPFLIWATTKAATWGEVQSETLDTSDSLESRRPVIQESLRILATPHVWNS